MQRSPYAYSHMPYPDMLTPNTLKRLTVDECTADRLATRIPQSVQRIFQRCPEDALKAKSAQNGH